VSNGGTGNGVPGVPGSIVYSSGAAYGYSPAGAFNQLLKSGGAAAPSWGAVNLASGTEVSGTLPISSGGTGSSVQNFVDLSTGQSVGGAKTFTGSAQFQSSVAVAGNTAFLGTVAIGAAVTPGTPIFDIWSATLWLNFGPTAVQTNTDLPINVNGAILGDVVMLGVPNGSVLPNSCYTAWVSAPNQVTVRFNNYSLGMLAPPGGTFRVAVMRF
jgi:hypothetical protein